MNDHTNAFRGLIGGAVVGALLWLLICWAGFGLWCYFNPCPTVKAEKSYLAEPHEVERMKFHGVAFAESDGNGWWEFERDGKRCKL